MCWAPRVGVRMSGVLVRDKESKECLEESSVIVGKDSGED
jgi:hypothetical protein